MRAPADGVVLLCIFANTRIAAARTFISIAVPVQLRLLADYPPHNVRDSLTPTLQYPHPAVNTKTRRFLC